MKVLVDYDNISLRVRNQGALYIADRIFTKIMSVSPTCTSLDLRFYGGWDENSSMSRRGQALDAELRRSFPRILKWPSANAPLPVRLHAALAQSLESLPAKVFQNTLRTIALEKKLRCQTSVTAACSTPDCPLDILAAFINADLCPRPRCNRTPAMVLKVTEQKLVDTMIVADLVHLANHGADTVALISSDDDMWPGIVSAMQTGTHIIHFQTSGLKPSLPYRRNVPGTYTALEL